MEWYEIVIALVSTIGGISGIISIYKAKPERTGLEIKNMKEMLDEAHKMYNGMRTEKEAEHEAFVSYKNETMAYVAEFKQRFATLEKRLDKAEDAVFSLKGAIYQGYRCKYPDNIKDCPVIQEYENNHCKDCTACKTDCDETHENNY